MFNEKLCYQPRVYCGDADKPPKKTKDDSYYYKVGTRRECLTVGIGAGIHIERNSKLSKKSLQQIKYVGEKHESKFKKMGIENIPALIQILGKKKPEEMEKILKKILTKKDGTKDIRAYNSVILYLYRHGISDLPQCKKIVKK
jgi:hypothetical protein